MSAALAPLPQVRKAGRVLGHTLVLVDAGVPFAGFIHALRTDESRARYLHATSPALADQVAWLQAYARRDHEAYFVVETRKGEALGTVRLMAAQGHTFSWGSWLLKRGAPATAAIESALMVYAYALDVLGFHDCEVHVHADNTRVRAFHERLGAVLASQDDMDVRYCLSHAAIRATLARYTRFLPNGITVEA
jgi:RimJ/RimL family protein N-acetyltransferase